MHSSGKNIRLRSGARTSTGQVRENNEDNIHLWVQDDCVLAIVADGMGGAAAGEIASAMAIEAVLREVSDALSTDEPPSEDGFASAVKKATATANAEIHGYALEHPEFRGMGTTATVAGVLADNVYLAQVGDSRAYLVRDGVAQQITKDQSLMQKLVEAGELTEEEAEQSERRNIILQALGPEPTIKFDLTHQQLRRGDLLVLCSDGLSGQVKGDEIARIVTEEKDLTAACKRLIDRANENGGPDNITVIVVRFDGDGLLPPGVDDNVGHRVFPLTNDSGQTPALEPQPVAATTGAVTTGAIPITRRPTRELPPEAFVLTSSISDDAAAKRRSRGTLIALMFLLVFLATATWWVYRSAETIVQLKQQGTAPAPANPSAPAPSTTAP